MIPTLTKKNKKSIINPQHQEKDPSELTKEEFLAEINEARQQYQRGEFTRITPEDDLSKYLQEL